MIIEIKRLLASLPIPIISLIVFITSKNPVILPIEYISYTIFIWLGCVIMISVGEEISQKDEGAK